MWISKTSGGVIAAQVQAGVCMLTLNNACEVMKACGSFRLQTRQNGIICGRPDLLKCSADDAMIAPLIERDVSGQCAMWLNGAVTPW